MFAIKLIEIARLFLLAMLAMHLISCRHPEPIALQARQLLIVSSADWKDSHGTLMRYEKPDSIWLAVGDPIPVVIGKNGMAWGSGIRDFSRWKGPAKAEGDGKSPAGIFALGPAFGKGEKQALDGLEMPYVRIGQGIRCIEESNSTSYNRIIREDTTARDWQSADAMLREDSLYDLGAFVHHNESQQSGRGSCIFLHVWRGPQSHTAGCTAMDYEQVRELLLWLDPDKTPMLLQCPITAYPLMQAHFQLPIFRPEGGPQESLPQ